MKRKSVCINKDLNTVLTFGKSYVIESDDVYGWVRVIDDHGKQIFAKESDFMTLKDIRKTKIRKML